MKFICYEKQHKYCVKIANCNDKFMIVRLLHNAYHEIFPHKKILEVSTRAKNSLGINFSAFTLCYKDKKGRKISVESAYQASKVFEGGVQYSDLLFKGPLEAKMDKRIWGKKIIGFNFYGKKFSLEHYFEFYNWLYINTLVKFNDELIPKLIEYDCFTDTCSKFTGKETNCQAGACALFIELYSKRLVTDALENFDSFVEISKKLRVADLIELPKKEYQNQLTLWE